jgi:predicted AlkP superfamily pyrophosphatase or phosphodiesterase
VIRRSLVFCLFVLTSLVALANDGSEKKFRHVLLISVDGLHALDVATFVESHQGSALAELSLHGITYSNARTPANSDSFPGLLALVTGGSPISHGLFYDVATTAPFSIPPILLAPVHRAITWCLTKALISTTLPTFRKT